MKLGIIGRMDLGSGLQAQSLNYCKMLKPDKVLLIDSTPFNGAKQYPELYENFNTDKVFGFPNKQQYMQWLDGLTHILTAETFYNEHVVNYCLRRNIKTYIAPNYEFMDSMIRPTTPPTKYLMPSHWMLDKVKEKYPDTIYLPPPLFPNNFKEARETNFKRSGKRFLHIVGKYASKDRNGTKSLIEAMQYTTSDFEIVIKSQHELDFTSADPRIKFEVQNVADPQDLYKDFDAMILPRRYGGLCMPMLEALMSGLPVIMTDISPNNRVLPKEWLVPAKVHDKLLTRMVLDVYNADPQQLAMKLDQLCNTDLGVTKASAFEIGREMFNMKSTHGFPPDMFMHKLCQRYDLTTGQELVIVNGFLTAKTEHIKGAGITKEKLDRLRQRNKDTLKRFIKVGEIE